MHEGAGFSAKTLGKSLFHCKNDCSRHGPPVSSDKWKVPLDKGQKGSVVSK